MFKTTTIKEVKIRIGEACKLNRTANDLTREELAKALEVSSTTIQNIENGKNATLDNVLKVANHFGLLEDILKGINDNIDKQNNISFY
ncbi:XRE family transcriptional regulator [Brumimicrobium glaciale]|uniref:XRE family transcriptional regulator n=1 Tax=Brumimicrobium glaciale TaxID=200475 RepID=A0A4Q4KJ75_9FLAO|nr:helix-turn-helix transcriptional regulator [Brumimicrobium glaciale]RYM32880.1 XRE family transcriptional regulator [Brumimicrobium glaciale]